VKEEYENFKKKERRQLFPETEGEMGKSVKQKIGPKKSVIIKRELEILEHEISRLQKIQRIYAKQMLKFGTASWIFGLSTFFSAAILLDPSILGRMSPIPISLLLLAASVPILITLVGIRDFCIKINHMEHIQGTLLARYRRDILERIVWSGKLQDTGIKSDTSQ
jgi:hypothetical protein